MKKLRTFAVSMIIAAIGLLIYCAGFYIKSYEQNLAARQEYAELSQMAGVKNREGAGLLADGKKLMKTAVQKTVKKNAGKNREDLLNQKTKTVQMKSGNPSGFPGKFKKDQLSDSCLDYCPGSRYFLSCSSGGR